MKKAKGYKAKTDSNYTPIRQGTPLNCLSTISTRPENDSVSRDTLAGTLQVSHNALTLTTDLSPANKYGFTTATMQVLDIFLAKNTEEGNSTKEISVTLAEFMEAKGITDIKNARQMLTQELENLFRVRLSYKDKNYSFLDMRIIQSKGIKNSVATIKLTDDFYLYLIHEPVLSHPRALFKINPQYRPYSYIIGKQLAAHYRMNKEKTNATTIKVVTLLDWLKASGLPSIEDLKNAPDRHAKRRIIEPIEKALDELTGIGVLSWEYCNPGGRPLTDTQLKNINAYNTWAAFSIKWKWKHEPSQ